MEQAPLPLRYSRVACIDICSSGSSRPTGAKVWITDACSSALTTLHGPSFGSWPLVLHAARNAELDTDVFPTTMTKDYKQLKTQHVSGHVGSTLSDINSVSLAMPVRYMILLARASPY